MVKLKKLLQMWGWLFVIISVLFTRFVGYDWGLPYPMHPDERNIADAIVALRCAIPHSLNELTLSTCLHPTFFAYGQFSLYLGYFLTQIFHLFTNRIGQPLAFNEVVITLRFISGVASVITVLVTVRIFAMFQSASIVKHSKRTRFITFLSYFPFIFSPILIQFAHFGTTESMLILFFVLIFHESLKLYDVRGITKDSLFYMGLWSGLAIATKVSAVTYLALPIFVILYTVWISRGRMTRKISILVKASAAFAIFTGCTAFLFSPYNFLDYTGFLSSMQYESDVALGAISVFYTRQFEGTVPFLFQAIHIFPYTLGFPVLCLSTIGFFVLPLKGRYLLLRIALLVALIPGSIIYAKWTRFIAPVYPMMILMAILTIPILISFAERLVKMASRSVKLKKYVFFILYALIVVVLIVPGIAFLSVYISPDVRFTASNWIYRNSSSTSIIFSESANVIDLPVAAPGATPPPTNYRYHSIFLYDLEDSPDEMAKFEETLQRADYIIIPSRRVFMNHTCVNIQSPKSKVQDENARCKTLRQKYPTLNTFYKDLFSGNLGFEKVAEFTSYPHITLFGQTLITLPDEEAEETFTVFDHPVIRVYKRSNL